MKRIGEDKKDGYVKVVLDTNLLLAIYQFRIDIFQELNRIMDQKYTVCIIDKTVQELEKLINKSGLSDRRAAKFALSVIKKKDLKIIRTEDSAIGKDESVDDLLVKLEDDCIVATQDKNLKKRLKEAGIKVITIRQKKHLTMV